MLGAFVKGPPIRGIGGSFTSADEQFYYVPADSPIRTRKDADGKSIAISTNGSAPNMFALHLARQSLYLRLRRIAATLGVSLDDEDVVLGLHLAVRAMRFRRRLRATR